ncbi:DUF6130 family protein [Luteimonas panaciterrae]|uniref:DUF6130 family protein n=1 Tax=Luteimonas panaciterrae TaxID=363885 RepID=UPI001CFB2C40|nr:DUF6130 family protein [Luteimonas panaciterrae]
MFVLLIALLLAAVWAFAREPDYSATSAPVEPKPAIVVMEPTPGSLAKQGAVVVFRAENITMSPIFGREALEKRPRLGHLHVTVDDLAWHWVHTTDEPIQIRGFAPGKHKLLLELADPTHRVIDAQAVEFTVLPEESAPHR